MQRILDVGATLIDYERIVNEQNRRLIFFSLHAGYAGMVENAGRAGPPPRRAGLRLTPLQEICPAHSYENLDSMKAHSHAIGAPGR
ncbi:MAG: hypothetical protein IPG61_15810 [bacterium]|nr:hypothetical protein [bacterium]